MLKSHLDYKYINFVLELKYYIELVSINHVYSFSAFNSLVDWLISTSVG